MWQSSGHHDVPESHACLRVPQVMGIARLMPAYIPEAGTLLDLYPLYFSHDLKLRSFNPDSKCYLAAACLAHQLLVHEKSRKTLAASPAHAQKPFLNKCSLGNSRLAFYLCADVLVQLLLEICFAWLYRRKRLGVGIEANLSAPRLSTYEIHPLLWQGTNTRTEPKNAIYQKVGMHFMAPSQAWEGIQAWCLDHHRECV